MEVPVKRWPAINRAGAAVAITLALAIAGCKTTGGDGPSATTTRAAWVDPDKGVAKSTAWNNPDATTAAKKTAEKVAQAEEERVSWPIYSSFGDEEDGLGDQGDHLDQLVAAKEFDDAAKLVDEQKEFFTEYRAEYFGSLRKVARHFNAKHEAELEDAMQMVERLRLPAIPADWPNIRKTLAEAKQAVDRYPKFELLKDDMLRAKEVDELADAVSKIEKQLRDDAVARLGNYDVFADGAFFAAYPVELDQKTVMAKAYPSLANTLKEASPKELRKFAVNYPKDVHETANWQAISDLYVEARKREDEKNGTPELAATLATMRGIAAAGFEPSNTNAVTKDIAVVQVPRRGNGDGAFPSRIRSDLPIEIDDATVEDAFNHPKAEDASSVIVLDIAAADSTIEASDEQKVESRYLAGHRRQPNPAYAEAEQKVKEAQVAYQNAASRGGMGTQCFGYGCLVTIVAQVAVGIMASVAADDLDEAMEELENTPATIKTPVYKPYSFTVKTVEAKKKSTVNYYVIDRDEKTFVNASYAAEGAKTFKVAYGLHPKDADRQKFLGEYVTEQQLAEWQSSEATVPLSSFVDHYEADQSKKRPYTTLASLKDGMTKTRQPATPEKSEAPATVAAERGRGADDETLSDPRLDHVVLIRSGSGIGAGFYIAPNVVLTNHHVIAGEKFVEITGHDDEKGFGRVIASDPGRDLALVSAHKEGNPVRFTASKLKLGDTVDAIGHPRGLSFSLSRGVVSAVRRIEGVNEPGTEVLYIQTDAPINQGNSGGPLFRGKEVVGVNTLGGSKMKTEGLNFAVHYTEVIKFIEKQLPSGTVKAM